MRGGIAALIVFGLVGCSTPYQSMGFSGGVEAQQMTSNTYRIVARGNGYKEQSRYAPACGTGGTVVAGFAVGDANRMAR